MQLVKIPASETEQQKLNLLAFHGHVKFNGTGKLVVSERHARSEDGEISASELCERIFGSERTEKLFTQPKVEIKHTCLGHLRQRRVSPLESPRRRWITDRRF